MVKKLGKSSGIFLSRISKNFEELVERKFVEGRVGSWALFNIKLDNVFETNVVDEMEGKWEGIVEGRFQIEVNEHEHVCFPKTCKKAIKSLRKLVEKERKVELKVIKKVCVKLRESILAESKRKETSSRFEPRKFRALGYEEVFKYCIGYYRVKDIESEILHWRP